MRWGNQIRRTNRDVKGLGRGRQGKRRACRVSGDGIKTVWEWVTRGMGMTSELRDVTCAGAV